MEVSEEEFHYVKDTLDKKKRREMTSEQHSEVLSWFQSAKIKNDFDLFSDYARKINWEYKLSHYRIYFVLVLSAIFLLYHFII